jgi:hypothetical protein
MILRKWRIGYWGEKTNCDGGGICGARRKRQELQGSMDMNRVLRKIKQMWPDADPQEIMDLLDEYGTEDFETGVERVQLAVLKLCKGDRDRLPDLVEMAKTDWRDVLAYAEYPEESKTDPVKMQNLPKDKARSIRRRDRDQYEKWLEE